MFLQNIYLYIFYVVSDNTKIVFCPFLKMQYSGEV